MRSFYVFLALVATAVAQYNNYTFPPGFNPNLISLTDRAQWCTAERNTCPLICGGVASSNMCDAQTLQFSCICANGSAANVAPYEQTIPFFVCLANFQQCIQNNVGNLNGQEQCKAAKAHCGHLNASMISTTPSASASSSMAVSTAAASATGGSGSAASGTATAAATATKGAAAVVQQYSVSVLMGSLIAVLGATL